MSWHFLQEGEAASWPDSCLDGAPKSLLSLIPTLEESSLLDREMDNSRGSRSGMMSGHFRGSLGGAQLTLFPEVFRVKTSQQQVRVGDLPDPVQGFGLRCSESLRKLNHSLYLRKTVRTCVPVDSAPSSKALPAWGMTFDGACWELGTSTRLIGGTECGSWLPTPTASSYGSNQGGGAGKVGKKRYSLQAMAKMNRWPTPSATDWKGLSKPGQRRGQITDPAMGVIPAGGKLNPDWVEWLMGWPFPGWTALEPLETDKYLQWLQLHGESSGEGNHE